MPNRPYSYQILIVDDDEGICELQRVRLERCGHKVLTATSSREALAILESGKKVDLYLLDYGIENEITGLALYMVMKERGYNAPAILITGFEDPRIIVQAMRAGVRDFLPKSTDYLDDLPMAVERILRQLQLEQTASESIIIREKQEMLEAAFGAARLAAFVWNFVNGEFRLAGHFEDLIGPTRVSTLTSLETFLELLHPGDRTLFREHVDSARHAKNPFELQFRVSRDDNEQRWVFAMGRFQYNREGSPISLICVMHDFSERKRAEFELQRVHQKIQALNERLQMGMVETNHRMKNHLQNLISLLQYQVRTKHGVLTEEDVQGITSHIYGLAALHDVLVGEVKFDGDGMTVDAAEVLGRVIQAIGDTFEDRKIDSQLDSCRVSSRHAATLSVILNELLSNALKHGRGDVKVSLKCMNNNAQLDVSNRGSQFPSAQTIQQSGRTGLALLKMLCLSDFGNEPEFCNESDSTARASIRFTIPELPTETASSKMQ